MVSGRGWGVPPFQGWFEWGFASFLLSSSSRIIRPNGGLMGKARLATEGLVLVCTLALVGAGLCYGQGAYGEITGKVVDTSGAVIPGVEITVTNVGTGRTRTGITSESGAYRITLLPSGSYSVKAALTGFKTSVR